MHHEDSVRWRTFLACCSACVCLIFCEHLVGALPDEKAFPHPPGYKPAVYSKTDTTEQLTLLGHVTHITDS
jgi:hypothetical protein